MEEEIAYVSGLLKSWGIIWSNNNQQEYITSPVLVFTMKDDTGRACFDVQWCTKCAVMIENVQWWKAVCAVMNYEEIKK